MAVSEYPVVTPTPEIVPEAEVVLVVPCYNEAARLDVAAFRDAAGTMPGLTFCFVNDGSRDRTLEVLQALVRELPGRATVLDLPQNSGKAEAVRQGMQAALGWGAKAAGFWDADLATPLSELARFREVLDREPQVEVVIGSRVRLLGRRIQRKAARHYLGRVFATGASLTLGLPVYDTQCGAKLLRASPLARELFARPFLTRWVFDVELLARYGRLAAGREPPVDRRIYELPLLEWTDVAGSKVQPWDFVRSGLELLQIWRAYRR
jgi:dolichyl-phosphate beta-glucosyltransferase